MERNIEEKETELIINFGGLKYKNKQMAEVLGWPLSEIEKGMQKEQKFYALYNQGKTRAAYVIDMKLFEMAQSGDLRALAKLEDRQKKKK
tara:strand:- start:23377 stop:23646 length:270 start_codon:yes stop_codon:yes gene_type:complete